jgi:hypothetical protein
VFLAINFDSDLKGFLVPAFVMAWPLAAFALGTPRHSAAWAPAVSRSMLALAVAVPVTGLVRNLPHNNLRHERYFGEYFASLVEWLPPKAAFVYETYEIDAMLEYQAALESRGKNIRSAARREPPVVDRLLAEKWRLFAFPRGASDLHTLGYPLVPVTLPGVSVADWIAASPHTLAIWGVWPGLADALGVSTTRGPTWAHQSHVVLVRTPHGPLRVSTDSRPIARDLSDLQPGLAGVVVQSLESGGARLSRHGLPLVRADAGVVLATFSETGALAEWQVFPPGAPLRRPLDTSRLRLHEVMPRLDCEPIGDRTWTDVSRLATTGTFRFATNTFRAFDSTIVLYLVGAGVSPDARAANQRGGDDAAIHVEQFDDAAHEALANRLREDGVPATMTPRDATVTRLEVRVNDRGDVATFEVGMGGGSRAVIARGMADRPEDGRIIVCEAPLRPFLSARDGLVDFYLGAGGEAAFTRGWRTPEPGREGPTRWMSARVATARGSVDAPAAATIHLDVMPREPGATLELSINGTALGAQRLAGGWQHVTWTVPAGVWRTGLNDVQFATDLEDTPRSGDADHRQRTIAIRRWMVERQG